MAWKAGGLLDITGGGPIEGFSVFGPEAYIWVFAYDTPSEEENKKKYINLFKWAFLVDIFVKKPEHEVYLH